MHEQQHNRKNHHTTTKATQRNHNQNGSESPRMFIMKQAESLPVVKLAFLLEVLCTVEVVLQLFVV